MDGPRCNIDGARWSEAGLLGHCEFLFVGDPETPGPDPAGPANRSASLWVIIANLHLTSLPNPSTLSRTSVSRVSFSTADLEGTNELYRACVERTSDICRMRCKSGVVGGAADRAASAFRDAATDWFIVTIGMRRGRRGRSMCKR
jgi:hypothetical protein